MPVGFILCGLFIIYLLFDKKIPYRIFYIAFLATVMVGFFIPVLRLETCMLNIVLFFAPLVLAFILLFKLSVSQDAWLFLMITMIVSEYLILIKINNNLSFTMSLFPFALIFLNTIFVPQNIIFPFTVFSISVLEIISIFYYNPNNLNITLGNVDSFNFILLNTIVFALFSLSFSKLRKVKHEKVY